MIFNYIKNAITMKDIYSWTYDTYTAMSLNKNQYNNDSSNTFLLLSCIASELYRSKLDIEYYPTFRLSNIDFTMIDRINRFNTNEILALKYTNDNSIYSDDYIYGYSALTNITYDLENINSYGDFLRHSIPCDIFLIGRDTSLNIEYSTPKTYFLSPNILFNLNNFNVQNSNISIQLLSFNILPYINGIPKIKISGLDKEYNVITEELLIDRYETIISVNEYSSITSLLCTGVTDTNITIKLFPYIIHNVGISNSNYVDRDDIIASRSSFYRVNTDNNSLKLSILNDTECYPPNYDDVEEILLNIPSTFSILNYTFDNENGLLYLICNDSDDSENYIVIFPVCIPFSNENFKTLKKTNNQTLKVSYTRDTINKVFSFEVFPTSSTYNFESMEITLRYSYKRLRGVWEANRSYYQGDLVVFNGEEYICSENHISDSTINIIKFIKANIKIVDNFLLELISSGIESNRFDISFDKLFPFDTECIVDFTTNGFTNSTQQILCQYHKLDPCIIKPLKKLFESFKLGIDDSSSDNIIHPIQNTSNKLLNKHEVYKFSLDYAYTNNNIYTLYKLSDDCGIYLNGFKLTNVFNTFYLDNSTNTIITSDTITHLFNQKLEDIQTYTKFIVGRFDGDNVPIIISDSYDRLFVNKKD